MARTARHAIPVPPTDGQPATGPIIRRAADTRRSAKETCAIMALPSRSSRDRKGPCWRAAAGVDTDSSPLSTAMPVSFRLGRPISAPAGTFPLASGWGHSEDFPSNVEYVMSNTSGTRDTVRDAARDARDAAREAGKATSAASDDIQADLEALRND